MLKRAMMFAIMVVSFSAASQLFAGAFLIDAPKKVNQGASATITITTDQSTATHVKLFITTLEGTSEDVVELVNGVGKKDHTFSSAGSVILKVEDDNNAKSFNTQMLHVQPALGGNR